MTGAGQNAGSTTHLQSCGLPFIPRQYYDAYSPALILARAGLRLPSRHSRRRGRTVDSPTARLFHHGSNPSQGASSSPVLLDEDDADSMAALPGDLPSEIESGEQDSLPRKSKGKAHIRIPFQIHLPKVNIESAIETMRIAREHGLTTEEVILRSSPPLEPKAKDVRRTKMNNMLAVSMKEALHRARQSRAFQATLSSRRRLPLMANKNQESLLKLVNDKDVAVILAKTGSGKTTQVPQILLDDMIMSGKGPVANIVCTQPRRIAATSVAQRVAHERHDASGRCVGYHIRNDSSRPSAAGSITYCTTGILMNRLIADAQATLTAHSHIIVDEVHERDIQIDLVLTLLRDAVRVRKAAGQTYPKLILMSATIDPSTFLEYFARPAVDGNTLTTGCLDVEGRHVHVEDHYLPDILLDMSQDGGMPEPMDFFLQGHHVQSSRRFIEHEMQFASRQAKLSSKSIEDEMNDREQNPVSLEELEITDSTSSMRVGLVTSVIAHIALTKPEGDILAFFPGASDMENAEELLRGARFTKAGLDIQDADKFRLFKLHSLRRETNNQVFDPVPKGCRRIVLATNIAETSITLPEVIYVVDTGKERNNLFDPSTLARSLPYDWISKTSSIQRRGRAGRVRNGHYYALFTKERYDSLLPMNRPEIGETDLADVALQFKAFPQHTGVENLLLDTVDPPSPRAVANAIRQLQALGALTDDGQITSLGRLLWQLGVHPALGKGILLGSLFGCLEPMLIVACHDPGSPLISNLEVGMERLRMIKQEYLPEAETDFAWIIEAFREYHAASVARDEHLMQELRETKFIRHSAYLDMMRTAKGVHGLLASIGFVPPPSLRKSIFESLPPALNANRNNMSLVKALLLNTVSAELAAWRGRGFRNWSVDSPLLGGVTSKQGVHEAKHRGARRLKRMYRSSGRLTAYTWKREAPDSAGDLVFLEQSSMVTPLMAILFCQDVALQSNQTLQLNNWLRLKFSMPTDVPSTIADHSAVILMELRKTMDRFISLGWLELERLNAPQTRGSSVSPPSTEQGPSRPHLGPELRKAMVHAVLKMLKADETYWEDFRFKRRAEIAAAEQKRAEKEKLEAEARSNETESEFDEEAEAPEVEAEAQSKETKSKFDEAEDSEVEAEARSKESESKFGEEAEAKAEDSEAETEAEAEVFEQMDGWTVTEHKQNHVKRPKKLAQWVEWNWNSDGTMGSAEKQ